MSSPAQDAAEGSVRLLLTKNPACFSFEEFPWLWQNSLSVTSRFMNKIRDLMLALHVWDPKQLYCFLQFHSGGTVMVTRYYVYAFVDFGFDSKLMTRNCLKGLSRKKKCVRLATPDRSDYLN